MKGPLDGIGDPRLWCGPSRPAPRERPLYPSVPTLREEIVQEFLDARPFRARSRRLREEIADLFEEAQDLGRHWDPREGDQEHLVGLQLCQHPGCARQLHRTNRGGFCQHHSPDQRRRFAEMWLGPRGRERMGRMIRTRAQNPEWARKFHDMLTWLNADGSWRAAAIQKRSLNPAWHHHKSEAAKRRSFAGKQAQFRQKLSDEQVADLCRRRAAGEKLHQLALEFGVSPGWVSMATRGFRRAIKLPCP